MAEIPKILLVDDDPKTLYSYQELLTAPGREIITASSGDEALTATLKHQVALILMDVNMPELDGFQTAYLIKERKQSREIPIIFITGEHKSGDFIQQGYKLGIYDYIVKPVDNQLLKNKVHIFLTLHKQKSDELAKYVITLEERNRELENSKKAMLNIMKELETKKTDLERSNQELEQFAYIASHDLQEPLRMVSSYMHLLDKKYTGRLDAKADKWIHYAVDGAQRMQGMIEDILVYSRVGRKEDACGSVDVNEVMESVLKNLKEVISRAEASVKVENLPVISGERGQLTQLFQNLVQNGIKFKGENAPAVEITAKKEGNQWVFAVSDNGIGIDPRFSDTIFTMFKRLHGRSDYEGTGIGLAITKKIVERHGGKIWVESEVGKGSVFYFSFLAC